MKEIKEYRTLGGIWGIRDKEEEDAWIQAENPYEVEE